MTEPPKIERIPGATIIRVSRDGPPPDPVIARKANRRVLIETVIFLLLAGAVIGWLAWRVFGEGQ